MQIIYFGEFNKGLKVDQWNYMNISENSNYTIMQIHSQIYLSSYLSNYIYHYK
ncbi:unnamed protein product [Paramecium sonneborni]|uniref:Uncharacterized protein n=1 Tax=Paramecium sonneborni TaxID=65129 RepID=A0A8S1RUS1_9CILI|nr:unnamed protein product [Paramecium sonneborni]